MPAFNPLAIAHALDDAQLRADDALSVLWSFVERMGFDPVRVIEAHAGLADSTDHRSIALAVVATTVAGTVAKFIRADVAATIGFKPQQAPTHPPKG
jgi:hypothetical protein